MVVIPKTFIKQVTFWIPMIAGNVLILMVLVMPAMNQSTVLASSIANQQALIAGKSIHYAQLAQLVSEVRAHQSDMQKISGSWDQSSTSLSSLIYFLQQQAIANGLTVSSIGFENGSLPAVGSNSSASSQKVIVLARMSGSYQSLKVFLEKIETVIPLLEVTNLSFVSVNSGQAGSSEGYQFSITIQAL